MRPEKLKRLAAELLNVGESRVFIDSNAALKIKEAITKDDVRNLISEKVVLKRKYAEQSRARARKLQAQRTRGRRRGKGKKAGTKKARMNPKLMWISRVRSQRETLTELKKAGKISPHEYRKMYRLSKGNYFRGKRHVESFAGKEIKAMMEKK